MANTLDYKMLNNLALLTDEYGDEHGELKNVVSQIGQQVGRPSGKMSKFRGVFKVGVKEASKKFNNAVVKTNLCDYVDNLQGCGKKRQRK